MKYCKYCNSQMMAEYQTNSHNSHRYKAHYTCTKCGALCDGEYFDKGKYKETISEKWWKSGEDTEGFFSKE